MKPAEKNILLMFDTVWFLYSPSIRSVHAGSSGAYLYQSGQQTMNRNRFREEKYSRSKQAEDARLYRPEQKQCLFLLFTCGRRPAGHVMMSVVGVVGVVVVVVVVVVVGGEQLLYMGPPRAHVWFSKIQ